MLSIIPLPRGLEQSLAAAASALIQPEGRRVDFSAPRGEEALVPPDSVSWRIFKNPIGLYVGGIAAVILELAEPAVRTGVWQHSTFLQDPVGRLRRTGMAAMVTVYGPRSVSEPMIGRVVRMHQRVRGETPSGERFCAHDPALVGWVHATASFGFASAYHRYVSRLEGEEVDRLYREGTTAARLYGTRNAPQSQADVEALFERMRERLEPSDIVFEFLRIMRTAPTLPKPLRWAQPLLVRAAVELIPEWVRARLGLTAGYGLRPLEAVLVRLAGGIAEKIVLIDSPAAQSCQRLGLAPAYLYAPRYKRF